MSQLRSLWGIKKEPEGSWKATRKEVALREPEHQQPEDLGISLTARPGDSLLGPGYLSVCQLDWRTGRLGRPGTVLAFMGSFSA